MKPRRFSDPERSRTRNRGGRRLARFGTLSLDGPTPVVFRPHS